MEYAGILSKLGIFMDARCHDFFCSFQWYRDVVYSLINEEKRQGQVWSGILGQVLEKLGQVLEKLGQILGQVVKKKPH